MSWRSWGSALLVLAGLAAAGPARGDGRSLEGSAGPFLRNYCIECHGGDAPEAHLDLSRLLADPSLLTSFNVWERVADAIERRKMPPSDAAQPADPQRQEVVRQIREEIARTAERFAGDPGTVVLRRLTSAEYAYSVRDLTGVEFDFREDLIGDAAGGEGFTNIGTVQFVEDGTLERYLAAAKKVAACAVIGAGPLRFFRDPGLTGRELSAIDRIQRIYRQHGFRTGAGEGAEPYGLDRYPKAFFVAWLYRHRAPLGLGDATRASLADKEQVSPRFVEHVWDVLHRTPVSYPTREIVQRWQDLPVPAAPDDPSLAMARQGCTEIYEHLRGWQQRLAAAVSDQEEAAVLSDGVIRVDSHHAFRLLIPLPEERTTVPLQFAVIPADPARATLSLVHWRDAQVRYRSADKRWEEWRPLADAVRPVDRESLRFGRAEAGSEVSRTDFLMRPQVTHRVELTVPAGATSVEVQVRAELVMQEGDTGVVRCELSEFETSARGKTVSALLADPRSGAYRTWQAGASEFARLLPQVSHREPAPSDRDPIPAPFDNTYNAPERDHFHVKVKYHRDDAFLVEHVLDDTARRDLDQAWADLLGSFDYHDVFLQFVARKFQFPLEGKTVASADDGWIEQLPADARPFVRRLKQSWQSIQESYQQAEAGHLQDLLQFASRAWRRPVPPADAARLTGFYDHLRREAGQDHLSSVRAVLTRILVSPAFLFRTERPGDGPGPVPLNSWEMSSRLSYFLWSSVPDAELIRAAESGALATPEQLASHARRMLRHPQARRLATEFFGQWFGFYQFDRYRGVDPERFPEFTDELKESLLSEAVSFFEHIVRADRPVREILFADYAFLDERLAAFYGVDPGGVVLPGRVDRVQGDHRGGLLGLGAVLTVTSAPLRTSPVKRGDWILRRLLGTPVPPPPADAGSIPADDVLADGRTVKERLAAHRRSPTCANCHVRIDPLGMALENYDPIGRWRDRYRDGGTIDASGTLADGSTLSGTAGLQDYLRRNQSQFYRTLCLRLLGYALGRGEQVSDQQLLDQMYSAVADGSGSLSDVITRVVASPQFRYRRGSDNRPTESLSSRLLPPEERQHGQR